MTEDNFVDYVKIHVSSGKGGSGSTHLRREKYVAKGGPDGGDEVQVLMEKMKLSESLLELLSRI